MPSKAPPLCPVARVVVLRGAGKSFCGGGDVLAMHAHRADLPAFIDKMIDAFHGGVMAQRRLPIPVIASVHGAVAGGGFSLALACDLGGGGAPGAFCGGLSAPWRASPFSPSAMGH